MSKVIGIDLGTTNSCVATIDERGRPLIIRNRQGETTTPSIVSYGEPGSRPQVGMPARREGVLQPESTVFGVKRLIGRRYDDAEVQAPLLAAR